MASIAFDKLNFTPDEEIIVSGLVDDVTATQIQYGETTYDLTDSMFSFNLGNQDAGDYEIAITIVDGDSAGQVLTDTIVVAAMAEEEEPITEEEALEALGEVNDPSLDFVPDYKVFEMKDTSNIDQNEGSRTGFEPIETTEEKFPVRRNVDITHPGESGTDGLFNFGKKSDAIDEKSDGANLSTRSGGMGSPIATTGFTF